MSLFEFIASELSSEDKTDLFSDKTVCLCLFQVALTPLEQQLIYKFLFLDPESARKGLRPKCIANALMQNPPAAMTNSQQARNSAHAQSQRAQQQSQGGGSQVEVRLQQCKAFFKKLEKLDLLEEVQEPPSDAQVPPCMFCARIGHDCRPRQIQMPRMALFQRDPQSDFMAKLFALKPKFQQNMLDMMSENLQLKYLQQNKPCRTASRIESDSKERWKRLIYFLLNIDSPAHQVDESLRQSYTSLLQYANYLETSKSLLMKFKESSIGRISIQSQSSFHGSMSAQQQTAFQSAQNLTNLTSEGFQFILQDEPSQVHNILLHYIKRASKQPSHRDSRVSKVVEILQFIFNLTLTEHNCWYKLVSPCSDAIQETVVELHQLGLLTQKTPGDTSSRNKFCINQLMQSFLHAQKTQGDHQSSLKAVHTSDTQKFIIVESNFKVYAYTDSLLYKAILRLFMREDYRFSNLIVGMLTRDSLKEAFKKKITTQQIMNFLETHAHPISTQSRALAAQNRLLLEQQNNQEGQELTAKVRARDFSAGGESYFEEMKSMNIGNLFGLSREQGLASVSQQLQIWENELNCLHPREGVLIKFENPTQHAEFKVFKDKKSIRCLIWSDEWKNQKNNVVVVDKKFVKEAYQFINECKS